MPFSRRAAAVFLPLCLATGCSVLVPAHPKSAHDSNESIKLRMLTYEDMSNHEDYKTAYESMLGVDLPKVSQLLNSKTQQGQLQAKFTSEYVRGHDAFEVAHISAASGPAAAGVSSGVIEITSNLAGMAIDYVQRQIEEEAEKYSRSWQRKGAFDNFWRYPTDGNGEIYRVQNYAGFELVRECGGESSCSMVFAFTPSADQTLFLVTPIYLSLNKAKAKVAAASWYSFLWDWALSTGTNLDLEVAFNLTGAWIDDKGVFQVKLLGAETFMFHDLDLDSELSQRPIGNQDQQKGWFVSVPTSSPLGFGTFWLELQVTENDSSNTEEYLRKGAAALDENRASIIESVVGKKPDPSAE